MDSNTLTASATKEVEQLFALGAHLGHKKNRLHPKARRFVYSILNGVSVIDLTMTVRDLEKAKKFLKAQAAEGKTILVVATKKTANQTTSELCDANKIPYVTTKWLPGLLTNFDTLIKNVRNLQTLKDQKAAGEWDQFVKHERMQLDKKIAKRYKFYGGLLNLAKKPDMLLVVDIKKEKNAVDEAQKNRLPVVAIVDTNSNPDLVDYPIVVNDDSASVMSHIINELISAYVDGMKKIEAKVEKKAETKETDDKVEVKTA